MNSDLAVRKVCHLAKGIGITDFLGFEYAENLLSRLSSLSEFCEHVLNVKTGYILSQKLSQCFLPFLKVLTRVGFRSVFLIFHIVATH